MGRLIPHKKAFQSASVGKAVCQAEAIEQAKEQVCQGFTFTKDVAEKQSACGSVLYKKALFCLSNQLLKGPSYFCCVCCN